jgi:hypothetical protein
LFQRSTAQALPGLQRQRAREQEALDDLPLCHERLADGRIELEEAGRASVLRETVGTNHRGGREEV